MQPKVFISYRRADSQDVAGRINDRLVAHFGKESVFKDVDSISHGSDFPQAVEGAIRQSVAMCVLIGPQWISMAGSTGVRRLDDHDDYVRIEIETALKHKVPVIPVLVTHAEMPRPETIPESIRPLLLHHGLRVRPDPDFNSDIARLIRAIEGLTLKQGPSVATSQHLPPDATREGSQRPSRALASSITNLACMLEATGRHREAEGLLERVLSIYDQLYGTGPEYATTLCRLAELHNKSARYELAESRLTRAVQILEQTFGPEHPQTIAALNALAQTYLQMDVYSKAAAIVERVLAVRISSLGSQHPELLPSLENLRDIYERAGLRDMVSDVTRRMAEISQSARAQQAAAGDAEDLTPEP